MTIKISQKELEILEEYRDRLKEVLEVTGDINEDDLELCQEYTLDKERNFFQRSPLYVRYLWFMLSGVGLGYLISYL